MKPSGAEFEQIGSAPDPIQEIQSIMTPRAQVLVFSTIAVSVSIAVITVFAGDSISVVHASAAAIRASEETSGVVDGPIAEWRRDLLELAFQSASAVPVTPHLKNRSRMQEAVVATCLDLEQPRRALSYIEKIDNWRRGSAYADLAQYAKAHGAASDSARFAELAKTVLSNEHDPNAQDWPKERILSRLSAIAAPSTDTAIDDIEARVAELDAVVSRGNFDETRGALAGYARLFDRHFADLELRSMLADKIRSGWTKTPLQVRIEVLLELAETAVSKSERQVALQFGEEAREIVETARFAMEDRLPLVVRLASLKHRAGDTASARGDLDAAMASYETERARTVDIYRSRSVRSLAEGFAALGDTARAHELYALAVEEGVVNPNSRPRADDLVDVCNSMARHGVEPDSKLTQRLKEVQASLRSPW